MNVETEWNAEFERDVPVRIVCSACGAARALSTLTAVLVAAEQSVVYDPEDSDSAWVRQAEDFSVRRPQAHSLYPRRGRHEA